MKTKDCYNSQGPMEDCEKEEEGVGWGEGGDGGGGGA